MYKKLFTFQLIHFSQQILKNAINLQIFYINIKYNYINKSNSIDYNSNYLNSSFSQF